MKRLIQRGLPVLRRLFESKCHEREGSSPDDWLFLLKILVSLDHPQTAGEIVVDVIQSGFGGESFVWGVIFDIAVEDSDWSRFLHQKCASNPPDLFCGICYLDFSNHLAKREGMSPHPFGTGGGLKLLREWLSSDDPGDESYAMSAAETIQFLGGDEQRELLEIAVNHDSEEVRLIASEVLSNIDRERGTEFLRELCFNPATTKRAASRLRESGRADAIPAEINHPEFRALSEFCEWLRDPENFGEIADEIDCIGRKKLHWPPTGDEREFFFFKYVYFSDCQEGNQPYETGVGVVGSRTVSLVGHTNPSMSLREILAMHCCWELQQQGDARAPALLSIEEGERLLREPS